MFTSEGKKRALIIGNAYDDQLSQKNKIKPLLSCNEDVDRLNNLLLSLGFAKKHIHIRKNVSPKKYVEHFIKRTKPGDLLFIHFSGHGEGVGKIENKTVKLVSGWLNPDTTLYLSSDLEKKISNLENSKIIISSDSCFSGRFFNNFQNLNNEIYFIGSSNSLSKSNAYTVEGKNKSGSLILLYEYIYQKSSFNINFNEFIKLKDQFIEETKIGANRILVKQI